MTLPRTFMSIGLGPTLAALTFLLAGCGGGNSEIDNAELIRKDAPKADESAAPKPTGEAPPAKETPKP